MKKILLLSAMVAAASLLPACQNLNSSSGAQVPTTELHAEHYQPQFTIEDKTVQGEAKVHNLFGIFSWGVDNVADYTDMNPGITLFPTPGSIAKAGATYNATTPKGYDRLLGATYVLQTDNYFIYKCVKATVKGYPAKVKSFKKIDCTK